MAEPLTGRGVHRMPSSLTNAAANGPTAFTRRKVGLLAIALALSACAPRGPYLRVEDLRLGPQEDAEYHIAEGDVLAVRVWNQESMSIARAKVRTDGMISMPFLQDVEASGMTPADLGRRLQIRLKTYVVNPVVTVSLEERPPLRISVIGEVTRPGVYEVERGAGVLAALAAAGGLNEFANRDGIFVHRPGYWADDPTPARIRFTYDALKRSDKVAARFKLRNGDVLVVE